MKKHIFKLFTMSFLFAIIAIILTGSVFAQSDKQMSVNVPFNFNVGNQEFLAGKYNLKHINDGAFLIRKMDGSKEVIAPTPAAFRIKQDLRAEKIVFNRYGDKYFLRQIFANRTAEGFGLFESKAEKSTRKDSSSARTLPMANNISEQVSIELQVN